MSEEVLTATHDVAYWQRRALQAEQREAITADAYNQQQSSYRELETLYQASQERALRAEGEVIEPKYRTFEINEIQVYGGGPRDRRNITIQRRRQRDGSSAWSINERGNCLGKDGEWELEPIPSSRDDAYFERMRWLSIDAVLLAWEQLREKALENY